MNTESVNISLQTMVFRITTLETALVFVPAGCTVLGNKKNEKSNHARYHGPELLCSAHVATSIAYAVGLGYLG